MGERDFRIPADPVDADDSEVIEEFQSVFRRDWSSALTVALSAISVPHFAHTIPTTKSISNLEKNGLSGVSGCFLHMRVQDMIDTKRAAQSRFARKKEGVLDEV
jgi:hypothetical protein